MASAEKSSITESNSFSSEGIKASDLGNRIYEDLKKRDHGATRDELVAAFSIPRTSIYDAIRPFLKANLITRQKRDPGEKRRGRRSISFVAKKN